jgi:CHAD domain-containing protein
MRFALAARACVEVVNARAESARGCRSDYDRRAMADQSPPTGDSSNGVADVFVATYHDTPDRRLARARVTLSRRLERGAGLWEARIGDEILTEPGGPASLPDVLAARLTALLRTRELVEVARLRNGADDVALLEGQHVLRSFDDLESALREAVSAPALVRPKRSAPAVEHVREYLRAQLDELQRTDALIRVGDDPEAVHDFRVAVRRSRSVLRSTRAIFDERWLAVLRGELSWLAGELSALRDSDVLLARLAKEAGPEGAPVVKLLQADRRRARKKALVALSSARYLELLDRLADAVESPPVRRSELSLERVAAAEFARLRRIARRIGPDADDAVIHRARIRAKHARYAAELAAPIAGAKARRFIAEAKRFQDVVGAHQDATVAGDRLHGVAERSSKNDTAFVAGRLAERVLRKRDRARRKLPVAWRRLDRQGRESWKR